jgi:hypothetical protein
MADANTAKEPVARPVMLVTMVAEATGPPVAPPETGEPPAQRPAKANSPRLRREELGAREVSLRTCPTDDQWNR